MTTRRWIAGYGMLLQTLATQWAIESTGLESELVKHVRVDESCSVIMSTSETFYFSQPAVGLALVLGLPLQPVPLMATAQALLINTEKDNNMISVVESIAVGTPALTTNIPLNASYIRAFRLGIVKDGRSMDELREVVTTYASNCLSYREVFPRKRLRRSSLRWRNGCGALREFGCVVLGVM